MTRLPTPGKDSGTWGDILNDYLSQSHKTDGSLKDIPHTKITGLGTAAQSNTTDFATSTQGSKADSAIQADDLDDSIAAKITTDGSATKEALAAGYVSQVESQRQPDRIYQKSASEVMSSAPTFSTSSSGTISGQVIDLKTDPRIRWHGTRILSQDSTSALVRGAANELGEFGLAPASWSTIEFMVDCAAFEIYIWNGGSTKPCQLVVDGQRASLAAFSASASILKFDFGGRRSDKQPRRIQFSGDFVYFKEIRLAATDTLFGVPAAAPRLVGLGDSYMTGYAATAVTSTFDGYLQQLSRLLGYECNPLGAASGTGFVRAYNGAGAYMSRVPSIIASDPDMVFIQGSVNDTTYDTSAISNAATEVFATLRAGLPTVPILATGVLSFRPTTMQSSDAARNAVIKAAAQATGVTYIDVSGWVTGTGSSGSPQANGNADIYVYTDNVHPTLAGHFYIANRLAGEIRAKLPNLAR